MSYVVAQRSSTRHDIRSSLSYGVARTAFDREPMSEADSERKKRVRVRASAEERVRIRALFR